MFPLHWHVLQYSPGNGNKITNDRIRWKSEELTGDFGLSIVTTGAILTARTGVTLHAFAIDLVAVVAQIASCRKANNNE